ncbi:MAG: ABC transporter ATP-binding protein, partial [Phycisphaerales bacterium]|nr:ABC transporter ATP-binding protein [Phycisphaerales bacterium]
MAISSSESRYREFRRSGPEHTKSEALASERPKRDPKLRKHYVRQYRKWLWPYRKRLAFVFVLALVSVVLNLVLPAATKYIIDDILPNGQLAAAVKLQRLTAVCGGLLALLLFTTGIDTWRSYLMSVLNAKVIFRLRQRLFDRFLRLPLAELSDLKSGGIVSRLSQDTDKVTGLVQMAVITPGVATIRVVLTVAVLIFLSWQMALVASLMIPPIVLVNLMWIKKVRPIYRTMAEERERIDGRVTETFGGIRVVRAFRRERREERDYAVAHHTIIRKNLLAEKLQLVVSGGWGLLIPATTLAIVGVGGYLVVTAQGTVGDIVAFQMYAIMLLHPVSMIVNSFSATQQALAALERVFDILERTEEKPDVAGAVECPEPIREIRFDNVSFEYRKGLPVLHDISLSVPSGSVVALCGPSGGGKTTLTDLVARFHDPTGGAVLVNGADLRRIKLASYRQRLAVVPQETFLFDGTVRENVA